MNLGSVVQGSKKWLPTVGGLALISMLGLMSCTPAISEMNQSSPLAEAPSDSPETVVADSLDRPLPTQGQILPVKAEVELGDRVIRLEVAETPQQQAIGLMARETLPDDRGMLFPFDPPRPARFWMKNVLFPLDMVFVQGGEIIDIAADVPPCEATPCPTYGPANQPLDYVLELRGGLAAELGVEVGDSIEFIYLESAEETQPE